VPRSIDVAVADEATGTDGKGIVDVTYSDVDEEGRPFSLSAESVRGGPDSERSLPPTEPDARLSLKDGAELTNEAETGTPDRAAAVDLEGRVTPTHGLEVSARTSRARVQLQAGIAFGDQPVEGRAAFGAITGKGFLIAARCESIFVDGPAHPLIGSGA
jgi:hypothetical protein